MKQIHVFYSGKVQGIGFRYTVTDIAGRIKVYGWVSNLDDSRVELVAEADEEKLKSFLAAINEHFFRYIKDAEIEWLPAKGEFRDFQVKF